MDNDSFREFWEFISAARAKGPVFRTKKVPRELYHAADLPFNTERHIPVHGRTTLSDEIYRFLTSLSVLYLFVQSSFAAGLWHLPLVIGSCSVYNSSNFQVGYWIN